MDHVISEVKITSLSPYMQNKPFFEKKKSNESFEDFENRIWMNRAHLDDQDKMIIPAMQFKNCLANAAQHLSLKISGGGNQTYTKCFKAGIIVENDVEINIKKSQIVKKTLFVPGEPGKLKSGRVLKHFPMINKWKAIVNFLIFDPRITQEIFKKHLEHAGMLIGIGLFRPQNNGFQGRFKIESIKWKKS